MEVCSCSMENSTGAVAVVHPLCCDARRHGSIEPHAFILNNP